MPKYDFKILHSNEFECFTRDLLQASEHLRIESFAEGRDGGIDLRFAYDSTKTCIVQCKRYKDWNELKHSLKKEVVKVKKLNPDRYIISTSVNLNPNNRDEIKELFTPYIKDSTKDILGQADLNNLLGLYPKIETQYYKLWLTSTNVLETILHRNIVNWSDFEMETIKSEISKYVQNDSFTKAQMILQENRYVIISGIPGIGKTTLARMLVYYYLANDYEEFVNIVDDLDKACELYDQNKKQVFFFDDFLGSNFFVQQSVSFENKLISFINRIKKSTNTLFIMTTREYILSDAKNYYEKLDLHNIDIAKCTIDLSNYTEIVRARILYNHLAEANMPNEFIDVLVKDKNYEQIIKHPNFNPRVIEAFINQKKWNDISPENFMSTVIDFFDKPLFVWEKAFENLNPFARYALLVFATFGGYVYYEEWQAAFRYFCKTAQKDLNFVYDDILWKKSVNILQDCFIKISKIGNSHLLAPFNPSIMDFCVEHINTNYITLELLLKAILYPEQLTSLYTDSPKSTDLFKKHIIIPSDLYDLCYNIATKQNLKQRLRSGQYPLKDKSRSDTEFCLDFITRFPTLFKCHRDFIEKNYDYNELYDNNINLSHRLELIRKTHWENVSINPQDVLTNIAINYNGDISDSVWDDYIDIVIQLGLTVIFEEPIIKNKLKMYFLFRLETVDNMNNLGYLKYDINKIPHLLSELYKDISAKEDAMRVNTKEGYKDYKSNIIPQKSSNIDSTHEMFTSLYDNH